VDLEQGVSAGLGITVDPEGDVVILIVVGTPEHQVAVPVMPDVAIAFSRSMRDMARECQALQDELDELEPEEIQDRIIAIQRRFAAQAN
jgi:hypothetical protein